MSTEFINLIVYILVNCLPHMTGFANPGPHGVIFRGELSFYDRAPIILGQCTQRIHLIELLRKRNPPGKQWDIVFTANHPYRLSYSCNLR